MPFAAHKLIAVAAMFGAVCGAGVARAADAPTIGAIYLENCAICHGEDGRGPSNPDYQGPMLVGNAFIAAHDDAGMVAFLKKGREADAKDSQLHILMPPFDYLGEADLKRMVTFLRAMK